MWVNPRFRELTGREPPGQAGATEAQGSTPPEETGRRLATLPRSSREGRDAELRVCLDEFQGHPFVSVRLWERDPRSGWWPVRGKGISVRVRELAAVAKALREAEKIAGPSAPGRPMRDMGALPETPRGDDGFSEFGDRAEGA